MRLSPAPLLSCLLARAAGCGRAGSRPAGSDAQIAANTAARAHEVELPKLPKEQDRETVPGFLGATAWLNVDHALTLEELRGRVVVVDFWTSCCINCLHTLPTLAAIEKRFEAEPVVVVGVHSPKFDAESERERLRAAVVEYSIAHPVAVDGSMAVWNKWGVKSWPTVVVLDTKGRVVRLGNGEPNGIELGDIVAAALFEGKQNASLNPAKIAGLRPEHVDTGPLSFPGKVIALADGGIAVSDTAHHRIVIADRDGDAQDVIGSGLAGKTDGTFGEATFRKPQGLAEAGDILYVADTENHEIRAINRKTKNVSTVAGTGGLGRGHLAESAPAITTALRSPWDLAFTGGTLYVALAGSHQIGAFDPKSGTMRAFAGDGAERRRDGKGLDSSFAQPSGLATDGTTLFVADSETSSIRAITLASQAVRTIVGKDLFVFGDVDGQGDVVRLQHPIGIAWGHGALWVADTYNSKIKRIDPATGRTETAFGGKDRKDIFEPQGLFVRGNEILVSDTNHHRLSLFPIGGGAPKAFVPGNLTAPSSGVAVARAVESEVRAADKVLVPEVTIAKAGATKVHVGWLLPKGTGVNDGAPFRVRWKTSDGLAHAPEEMRAKGADVQQGFDVEVTPTTGTTRARLVGDADLVICDVATHRVCVPVKREIEMSFAVTGASRAAAVSVPLPEAKP